MKETDKWNSKEAKQSSLARKFGLQFHFCNFLLTALIWSLLEIYISITHCRTCTALGPSAQCE